jgi:crotonobetainyl-CoA:carnitine CoA-transferase CaiB-like acyl-CoA transferase
MDGRLAAENALDGHIADWTIGQGKFDVQTRLRAAGTPCSAVQKPKERVEDDPDTAWLWPTVTHSEIGQVRVDGLPARFSKTPWTIERGAPCLGEHNAEVFGRLLGMTADEVAQLKAEKVL